MIYFLCWDGKDYRITSKVQEGKYSEVIQILCNKDEAGNSVEGGVATVSGTSFGHLGEGFIRFSYAASNQQIESALSRISNLLSERNNLSPA